MSKTTEPAALAGIESATCTLGITFNDLCKCCKSKLYSAATVERLVQERDMARDHANRLGEQLRAEARISDAQLAASQAREQQLRDALEFRGVVGLNDTADQVIRSALSLPQDDTALKAWGEKLLREIADGCRDGIDRAWITSKADELMEEKGNG